MVDDEDCHSMVPREAAQQIDYLARGFSIEFAEALIGEQELWILNHGAGDGDSALLATREAVDRFEGLV